MSGQSKQGVQKNAEFFFDNPDYAAAIGELDTYQNIRQALDKALAGCGALLDIGNGGVFDYDASLIQSITAVDLFLDKIDASKYPSNITFVRGDALALPFEAGSFDTVLVALLLHHLAGKTVAECRENVRRCIRECHRVLREGGRLIIVESCVPQWFYNFECAVFPAADRLLPLLIKHPVTFQYTRTMLEELVRSEFASCEVTFIPKGKSILQFGFKVPSALTPTQPFIFEGR